MKSSDNPNNVNDQLMTFEEILSISNNTSNHIDAAQKNEIHEESKIRFKSFCKKQFDFSELSEIFPDKTIKEININLYRGPRYYPSHGIPPDEEISVVIVEFDDGSSMKVKFAKEIKAKSTITVGRSPQEHKYPNANTL